MDSNNEAMSLGEVSVMNANMIGRQRSQTVSSSAQKNNNISRDAGQQQAVNTETLQQVIGIARHVFGEYETMK